MWMKTFPLTWLLIPLVAWVPGSDATIHPPLVHHFLLTNHLKIVQFISCNTHTLLSTLRLANRISVYAGSANILGIRQPRDFDQRHFRHHNRRVAIVLDLQCPRENVRSLLASVSLRTFFHRRYFWLLFSRDFQQIEALLGAENVNVDAEITVATRVDNSTVQWDLWDVYNPSHARGGRLNVTHMQRWDVGEAPRLPAGWLSKYERRKDFGGLVLKGVLTIADIPANYTLQSDLDSTDFAYLDSMNRLNYRLFQMIQQMHNFRIYLIRSRYWGYLVNGSWIGAIGFTTRREVDICMTALRWSPERFGFYETTTYTYHVRVLFLFRHPKTALGASNIFVQPLVAAAWIATVAVGVGSAGLVRLMLVLEKRSQPVGDQPPETSWSNSLLMIFGILFQQGYDVEPRLLSARIVTISALFLSLMLFQFYSSYIVASLLMETPKTIRSIQQLLASQLECGIDEVSYIRDIFNHAIDPVAIRLYREKIIAKDNVFGLERGLEMIRQGGFAFHTDVSSTYQKLKSKFSDEEICELQEIAYAKPFACGPAVPNMSPLVELIKIDLRRMFEAGIHAYHSAIWEQKKPKCAHSSVEEVAPIDLEHFSSALYLLAMGMLLSAALCAAECIFAAVQAKRQRMIVERGQREKRRLHVIHVRPAIGYQHSN